MDVSFYQKHFLRIKEILNSSKSKNITILIHKNPDGDAIGCALGLTTWLLKNNVNVKIISTNFFSEVYLWMPNAQSILVYNSIFKETVIDHIKKSEVIFCLDFNQRSRIDSGIWELIDESDKKKVCVIDHHPTESDIINVFSYIETTASSTCEILYKILDSPQTNEINNDIATCLYTGMLTDTGKFSTPTVTSSLHLIVAEMIDKYSLNIGEVNKAIYGCNSIQKLHFLGYALNSKLKLVPNYKAAYISISLDEATKYHLHPGDTDGIVNYALSIKDVVVAAFFNQKKDGIYISFRSVGEFPVNDFASKFFGGGGHKNAAGGFSNSTLKKTIDFFLENLKKYDILKL